MKEIPLTYGYVALVDDEDYEMLSQFKWHAATKRNGGNVWWVIARGGATGNISMARFLMNAPKGFVVDHANHNTLDNRKSNLRVCSVGENSRNRIRGINNTSGYKGVGWNRKDKRWRATLEIHGKMVWIGNHKNKEDAARAYDAKAKEIFGEFAYLNFPEESA